VKHERQVLLKIQSCLKINFFFNVMNRDNIYVPSCTFLNIINLYPSFFKNGNNISKEKLHMQASEF
jgi:hypothetical protein